MKLFAFVLMPFSGDFSDVYNFGIKQACESEDVYCERVDEQVFEETSLSRIYNQIQKADLIIADMTGRNANVFYEVGYAHALDKRVFLCTQDSNDIPFDLKHHAHIVYGKSIKTLKDELRKRIRWCVDNPNEPITKPDFQVEFFISRQPLRGRPKLHYMIHREISINHLHFILDIHNKGLSTLDSSDYNIGIVTTDRLPVSKNTLGVSTLPDGTRLHLLQNAGKLFPNGWASISVVLESDRWIHPGDKLKGTLKNTVFANSGLE